MDNKAYFSTPLNSKFIEFIDSRLVVRVKDGVATIDNFPFNSGGLVYWMLQKPEINTVKHRGYKICIEWRGDIFSIRTYINKHPICIHIVMSAMVVDSLLKDHRICCLYKTLSFEDDRLPEIYNIDEPVVFDQLSYFYGLIRWIRKLKSISLYSDNADCKIQVIMYVNGNHSRRELMDDVNKLPTLFTVRGSSGYYAISSQIIDTFLNFQFPENYEDSSYIYIMMNPKIRFFDTEFWDNYIQPHFDRIDSYKSGNWSLSDDYLRCWNIDTTTARIESVGKLELKIHNTIFGDWLNSNGPDYFVTHAYDYI